VGGNLSTYDSAEETPTPTLPLSGGGRAVRRMGRAQRNPSTLINFQTQIIWSASATLSHLPLKGGGRFAQANREGVDLSAYESAEETPTPTLPLSAGGRSGTAGQSRFCNSVRQAKDSLAAASIAARPHVCKSASLSRRGKDAHGELIAVCTDAGLVMQRPSGSCGVLGANNTVNAG
jgi:hypothetical protein